MENSVLKVRKFNASFGKNQVVKDINMNIPRNKLIAIMGPSGCGKTTFLRCINRMHELTEGASSQGDIFLENEKVEKMQAMKLRSKIGMVFQHPNPFPHMTIYDNVLAGYKLNGVKLSKCKKDEIVEDSLQKAALWNEVKDALHKKGTFLSGGQQQRLCIARALAMKPEILLLDEPTSALDPVSTAGIEGLLEELKSSYTIVMVTHNLQQAARVSDLTAFFYLGKLEEYGFSHQVFNSPNEVRTQEYISGTFS